MRKLNILVFKMTVLLSTVALAGGTTGGGGNIPENQQVEQNELVAAAQRAKPLLISWLRFQAARYKYINDQGACGISDYSEFCKNFEKIFSDPISVYQIIDKMKIEIKTDTACVDYDQNPSDASVFASLPGNICLSVYSIKPKLSEQNYNEQIAALILHEISHLKGADEITAQNLQKFFIKDAFLQMPALARYNDINNSASTLELDKNHSISIADSIKRKDSFNGSCAYIGHITFINTDEIYKKLSLPSFVYMDKQTSEFLWSVHVKKIGIRYGGCSRDSDVNIKEQAYYRDEYDSAFGQKEIWNTKEIDIPDSNRASSLITIKKIKDINGIQEEFDSVVALEEEIQKRLKHLASDLFVTYQ